MGLNRNVYVDLWGLEGIDRINKKYIGIYKISYVFELKVYNQKSPHRPDDNL